MDLTSYQTEAIKFARYTSADYPFLALGEETGEVLGKIAKFSRKNDVTAATSVAVFACEEGNALRSDLIKELGDVLWQLSACCNELNVSLEEVAEANIAKLGGRSERGTLVGEGDDR